MHLNILGFHTSPQKAASSQAKPLLIQWVEARIGSEISKGVSSGLQIDEDGDRVKKNTGKRKVGQGQDEGPAPKKKKAVAKPKGGKGNAGKAKPAKKKGPAKGASKK